MDKGKTEKETRPNQPAREPSPPSTREPSTLRTIIPKNPVSNIK